MSCAALMSEIEPLHQAIGEIARRRPALSDDQVVDLIHGDYVRRVSSGEAPDVDAYADVFPDLREPILKLIQVERALAGGALEDCGNNAPNLGTCQEDAGERRSIGDFRVVREINRGGMGVVYEAERRSDGARVALKVLHRLAAADPGRRKRFTIEIHAASTLEVDGIVPVLVDGEDHGTAYFAMPLLAGPNLEKLLAWRRDPGPKEGAESAPPPSDAAESGRTAEADARLPPCSSDDYFLVAARKLADLARGRPCGP